MCAAGGEGDSMRAPEVAFLEDELGYAREGEALAAMKWLESQGFRFSLEKVRRRARAILRCRSN